MNPWLLVPATDYEAHMASPAVAQLQALSDILREDVDRLRPASLVVVGCATGNGFEHVDAAVTKRVVGIDINPEYLRILRDRFSGRLPGLELLNVDCTEAPVEPGEFDLVHAALVLEYVEPATALARMASWTRPGGGVTIVLQEPSAVAPPVSRSPYTSLQALEPLLRLVDPETVTEVARKHGLVLDDSERIPLPQAKSFRVLRFCNGCSRNDLKRPGTEEPCRDKALGRKSS